MTLLAYVVSAVVLVVCLKQVTAKRLPLVSLQSCPDTGKEAPGMLTIVLSRTIYLLWDLQTLLSLI
jgi:hypothetical protein